MLHAARRAADAAAHKALCTVVYALYFSGDGDGGGAMGGDT
jgi:hypothetical protein